MGLLEGGKDVRYKVLISGEGYFRAIGYSGCTAGWGHIFTPGLTMKREIFKRGIRMGSCTFGTFFYSENLKKNCGLIVG